MHVLLKGQILGSGQCHTRSGDTLDGRVVGQVREQDRTLQCAGTAELIDEEL